MIDQKTLNHVYKQLLYVTYSKNPDAEATFYTGLWKDEEFYKYDVWRRARDELQLETWELHKADSKYIYDRAIAAIDACGNLLVTEHSQYAQQAYISTYNKVAVTLLENLDKTAEALYGIFSTDSTENDGLYFDILATILKNIYDGYSYVAYFFFLKNRDEYAPVRRKANTYRLKQIGVNPSCMDPCNWNNYMIYMGAIKEVHQFLLDQGLEATLLDAHSFLWMLWMVDKDTPEYIEYSDPYETIITTKVPGFKEGKKIQLYSTKYERDPKLRREFLKTQTRPYTCEACGMNFEEVYGAIGEDVIDVHHKLPLSVNGKEQEVYPTNKYLACLCANCHRIIHRKAGIIMTVDELKKIIEMRRDQTGV